MDDPLRIAWIGGPTPGGGVGGFCRQLLTGLAGEGHDVTVFGACTEQEFQHAMGDAASRFKLVSRPPEWEWNRWYSRSSLSVFISSFYARRKAYLRLVEALVEANGRAGYDVIVQFSQTELFRLRRHLASLPPVLLFPCVHAAGELRWHRRESRYALRTESLFKHYVVRSNLIQRSWLQSTSVRAVHGVIGMSERFNQLIAEDYGVDPKNQAVVYQPVEASHPPQERADAGPVRLLFVGRVSVRKGIEMLTALSHRLDDVAGDVSLTLVGAPSFWSDYSKGIDDLNDRVAEYVGPRPHEEVTTLMAESDIFVIPSHYEPGGIVVAEALSAGCVVVASDEVGSAEPLADEVCRRFPRGDDDAFERRVRCAIRDCQDRGAELREAATRAARQCYDPADTQERLSTILRAAADRRPISEASVQPVGEGATS